MDRISLRASIETDVRALCAGPDRHPGSERNREAVAFVTERMSRLGLDVEELAFDVPDWRFTTARIQAGDTDIEAFPGPYSGAFCGTGRLNPIRTHDELFALDTAQGDVLLLLDELAAEQLTPRDYPFYSNPEHAGILDKLESLHPLAVIAANDTSAMTAAQSPFPLIEEVGFGVPHAYLHADMGETLASYSKTEVGMKIDSETIDSAGVQPIGLRIGLNADAGMIVVCAHIDTKPQTPGALDNAGGVAVLLAVADLLRESKLARAVEFVPFNGEDHTLAPGEMAYLSSRASLKDIKVAINIDGAGLIGSTNAYSGYGLDDSTLELLESTTTRHRDIVAGEPWPASDHMVFAMQGVPSVALTTSDMDAFMTRYAHTASDTPELMDFGLLESAARFIADFIERLGAER